MVSHAADWRDVQHALRHLYEPDVLRASPLLAVFCQLGNGERGLALRHLLCDTIRGMRPDDTVPSGTRTWRDYQILYHRYVRASTQLEVADQVGLSVRQLRREEHKAIRSLASRLEQLGRDAASDRANVPPERVDEHTATAMESDLAWIRDAETDDSGDLAAVTKAVIELIGRLATQHKVEICCSMGDAACLVAGSQVAIRQALLMTLSVVLRHAHTGCMEITLRSQESSVVFCAFAPRQATRSPVVSEEDAASISLARSLLAPSGGKADLALTEHAVELDIVLPSVSQACVMVIEDNVDAIRLIQGYLDGTRYRLAGASGFEQALSLAQEMSPDVIILDVLMPCIDGWESLQRLQHHPATRGVPVLVSTILPEEELALSLGAAGYLHKPFTRDELLAALERLVDPVASRLP